MQDEIYFLYEIFLNLLSNFEVSFVRSRRIFKLTGTIYIFTWSSDQCRAGKAMVGSLLGCSSQRSKLSIARPRFCCCETITGTLKMRTENHIHWMLVELLEILGLKEW